MDPLIAQIIAFWAMGSAKRMQKQVSLCNGEVKEHLFKETPRFYTRE